MPDSATKWTEAQQLAINTVDRSLLVSAAAGSGKTSVLAERCAYIVCDAPSPYRCDVTELLVVTFTEAAAAEMRSRIAGALYKRYQQSSDARLAHQLALIDRAQISTIHGFCSRILRQNFHLWASIRTSTCSRKKKAPCCAARSRASCSPITTNTTTAKRLHA
jgi:ATP-dependent helicase/nuclease subunit A